MSVYQVVPGDMTTASNAVTKAAQGARGHGSSEHLSAVGSALPGATSTSWLTELGDSWDDEAESWAGSADAFGAQIAAASDDAQGTDQQNGGLFGGLLGGG